jgi:hypothetical protein
MEEVMPLDTHVNLGEVLTFIGLLITAFAIWKNTKAQRASFLFEVYNSYPAGEDVEEIHSKVDSLDFNEWREEWWYQKEDMAMSGLLWYYDLIAYLLSKGILKERESEGFTHDFEVFAASKGVKQYLDEIEKMDKDNKVSTKRYANLTKKFRQLTTETSVWR